MLSIIVPCAGSGKRFRDEGYDIPKPMIEVDGKMLVQLAADPLIPKRHEYQLIFIIRKEHCTDYGFDSRLEQAYPGCKIIVLNEVTEGSAITALSASHLFYNTEVILTVCDNLHHIDIDDFLDKAEKLDGLIGSFETETPHFCFSEIVNGKFIRCVEKEPISTHAQTGLWYFKSGVKLLASIAEAIALNDRTNNEFYCTSAYNHMHGDIEIYNTSLTPLGTPDELKKYLRNR